MDTGGEPFTSNTVYIVSGLLEDFFFFKSSVNDSPSHFSLRLLSGQTPAWAVILHFLHLKLLPKSPLNLGLSNCNFFCFFKDLFV